MSVDDDPTSRDTQGVADQARHHADAPEGMVAVAGWGNVPEGHYAFPGPLRDRLVDAILTGQKTATSSLAVGYEREDEPLPAVGDLEAVLDSHGQPVCITRNTSVEVVRLGDVTDDHARREGEGFTDVQEWRDAHERFWTSPEFVEALGTPRFVLDDDTEVVCVGFAVVARLQTPRRRQLPQDGRPQDPVMADIDEHGRPEPPLDGDEWQTLTGFLEHQRATLAWKCAGLSSEQLARRVAASSMTLGGLLKHLAYVEDDWFGRWVAGEPRREPWASVDWSATPDWEWDSAADDSPEALRTLWEQAVERSRTAAGSAYDAGGLAQPTRRSWPSGESPSLRWVLTHMIEEYARHNGHADLLREAIDGQVGE